MSTTPSKKPKTTAQSVTMLNFFRPKPSVKELSGATSSTTSPYFARDSSAPPVSRPSSSSTSSSLSTGSSAPPREEKEVISLLSPPDSDDVVGPDSFEESFPSSSTSSSTSSSSSSSYSSTSTSSTSSSSSSFSSSSSSFSSSYSSRALSTKPTSTVTKTTPYSSSSSSDSWDALPAVAPKTTSYSSLSSSRDAMPAVAPKPSPYASAASSGSWDSLPKSSSSLSSKPLSTVKPSYPKVVPSYAPVTSSSSSGSAAPNRYVAEIAKSGRATCRDFKCKQKIDKNELRIGKVTPNYFHEGSDDVMTQWFHPPCIFSALSRAKQLTKKIERVEDIENFEGLSDMHQNWIRDLMVQTAGMIKPPPVVKAKSVAPSYSSSSSGSGGGGGGPSSGVIWEFNKDGSWYAMAPEDCKMLEDHYTKAEYHFSTKEISFNKVYQTLYMFHLNGADPTQVNTNSGTATHLRRVVPSKTSAPPPLVKAKSGLKPTSSSSEVCTGWEWFNKDRWTPFAAEDAAMLEGRFQKDDNVFETKKLSFNLAHGTNYKFVLNSKKPTQTNCSTGTVTPIRRVAPPSAADEEEDWWGDEDDTTAATTAEPEEEEEDEKGPATVWWEWSNMGSWDKFLPKDSKMLESKWKNGELIFCHVISYGGRDHEMYKFNLKGPNPTQRNTETGLTRSLRRRKAGVEPVLTKPKEESDHCWHWRNGEVWTHFMAEDSKMLEERFQSGDLTFETHELSFNKGFPTVYRFNLGGSNPSQKNTDTGSIVALRRAPLSKKEASSSPKKTMPTKSSGGEKQAKKSDGRWEWNKTGDWLPYAGSDNLLLEARFQAKDFVFVTSKLSFNAGFSTEYKFLLHGDAPSQTNLKTGVVTSIRRVGVSPSPSTEEEWW